MKSNFLNTKGYRAGYGPSNTLISMDLCVGWLVEYNLHSFGQEYYFITVVLVCFARFRWSTFRWST